MDGAVTIVVGDRTTVRQTYRGVAAERHDTPRSIMRDDDGAIPAPTNGDIAPDRVGHDSTAPAIVVADAVRKHVGWLPRNGVERAGGPRRTGREVEHLVGTVGDHHSAFIIATAGFHDGWSVGGACYRTTTIADTSCQEQQNKGSYA
ncbi:hypothetical protein A2590_01425 [Candidatus Adlerbacteria bacterium RIFOXYD1_FULL_48_8]|nr:MAG: hypothetical protein A2590_01425 [Candidatus Adlerbacteria bacterium RIFOXYD1_FULL_48_8]